MAWWRLDLGSLARVRGERRAAREATARTATAAPEARAILSECCTFRAPALLIDRDSGERIEGRFGALGEDEVRLDLPAGVLPVRLRPLSVCLASFAHRGGAAVFMSRVRRIDEPHPGDGSRQIVLEHPRQVAQGDLRAAARFATPRGCGLAVQLLPGDRHPVAAQPLDMSLCGIHLELDGTDAAAFPDRARTEIELRLGERRTRVWSEVRRREGPRVALCFLDALRDGRVQPPAELARIVRELEQRALRLRGGLPWPPDDRPGLRSLR